MGVEKTERVWHNGKLIAWDDANVHILTHTLHYGLGVFEGIRCYRSDDGRSNVFRLKEHVERLHLSAKIVEIDMTYSRDQIEAAILDTLRANRMAEGYIRPIVYLGAGAMGLLPKDNPTQIAIIVWPCRRGVAGGRADAVVVSPRSLVGQQLLKASPASSLVLNCPAAGLSVIPAASARTQQD